PTPAAATIRPKTLAPPPSTSRTSKGRPTLSGAKRKKLIAAKTQIVIQIQGIGEAYLMPSRNSSQIRRLNLVTAGGSAENKKIAKLAKNVRASMANAVGG